jgi:DNA (cytosine-5)-methyltransferase 1
MKIATVFSGIGAPEYTLKEYFPKLKPSIVFACDCGETKPLDDMTLAKLKKIKDQKKRQVETKKAYSELRKQNWIKTTYFSNYASLGIIDDNWFDDIRLIDGKAFKGQVGLFIGGSPCQSFSNMGHRGGLEDTRGTLFYDYARLVKEIEPDVFIYENVPGMLTHDSGKTWKTIDAVFNSLGYTISSDTLNSEMFDIPQRRKRLFVVGFKDKEKAESFVFPKGSLTKKSSFSFHEKNIPAKYYLSEKGFKFTTTNTSRAKINMDIIRTEKRNQQFNWNGDFVFVPKKEIQDEAEVMKRAYIGKYKDQEGAVRKMTPRECHNLMGFKDDFIICENDTQAYKQAGNSIVVDVLKELIQAIIDTGVKIK